MADPCVVCELPKQLYRNAGPPDVVKVQCVRCGNFEISGTAMAVLAQVKRENRPMISEWIGLQNQLGEVPRILDDDIATIIGRRKLTWREKADRLLIALLRATSQPGAAIDALEPQFSGMLQTYDSSTALFLCELLRSEGWVDGSSQYRHKVHITPKGFIHTDELLATRSSVTQGFVAMWFTPPLNEAWVNGFQVGIKNSGYDPLRIDMKEHSNKICDEIVAEIRRSRFVVADFTGHRGGVYFEAGYASGLGLPVIWTCKHDALDGLHFDIRQYNCIDWKTETELASRLTARILALIGEGPRNSIR